MFWDSHLFPTCYMYDILVLGLDFEYNFNFVGLQTECIVIQHDDMMIWS